MRLPSRLALRRPWIPAAVAALTLSACGGSDEAKKGTAGTTPAAAPTTTPAQPVAAAPSGEMVDLTSKVITPLVAPLDGPREYEVGTEKPLVASFPASSAEDVRPTIDGLPADDELLGRPLVINGKVIPFEEIKRQCCLGRIGVAEIETAKLDVFLEEEIQRQKKAGASAEQLAVGDEELKDFLAEVDEQIKLEYPEGDVTVEDLFSGFTTDQPKDRLRDQKLFQKVFLPDDPSLYPPITIEALLKTPGGDLWLEELKANYAARQTSDGAQRKTDDLRALDEAILASIVDHLYQTAVVEAAPAPGVLYRVNGVDIRVNDIWERIKPMITIMEVHVAKQWIVNSTLLKDALVAAGAWLSDEEADAAYRAHSDPYKDSIFSYERIAVSVKQFPSVDRYKQYHRIYESFHRLKKPEVTEEALKKQGEYRTDKIVGQVTVDADVILCSAFDLRSGRWKKDGWVEAENRMKDVLQLLVEEQRPWEEMVEKYSDFYEPPMPVSARENDMGERPVKGRFRNAQRNNMLNDMGESEYDLFLNGSSITDFIFYEQEVGTLGQPMRGPLGWYLPRLIRRSKPPRQLTAKAETLAALRLDDFLVSNLNRFVQELIEKNEVYGLELPGTVPK